MTDIGTEPELGPGLAEVESVGRLSRTAAIQMVGRTGALRAIAFVGTVLLARVLVPADYGTFAVVAFVVAILGPLGELGMGAALIQKRERPTDAELATVFTAQLLLWLAILPIVWVLAPLVRAPGAELPIDIDDMIRVAAVAVAIGHLSSVPGTMMARILRFGPLVWIEIVQLIVYFATAVLFAVNGAGAWSLVIGLLAQFSVGSALMYIAWGRLPGIGIDRPALRRMIGFGSAFQATNVVTLMREAAVPVFGGLAGGIAATGQLQFGQRLGRLVGGADEIAARIAFPAFSRMQDDRGRLEAAVAQAVTAAALLLGPVLLWTIAAAPTLLPTLFSDAWTPAVPVFQLTALAALAGVPIAIMRGIALGGRNARGLLVASAVAGIVTLIAFPFLVLSLGLTGGGIGFLLYAAIQLTGYWLVTRDAAALPWLVLARIYVLAAAAAVPGVAILAFVGGWLGLVISGLVFGLTYVLLVAAFERGQLRRSWQLLRGASLSA